MTVDELSKRLSLSRSSTWRLIYGGEIKTTRIGKKSLRVSEQALADYLKKQEKVS